MFNGRLIVRSRLQRVVSVVIGKERNGSSYILLPGDWEGMEKIMNRKKKEFVVNQMVCERDELNLEVKTKLSSL